MPRPRSFASPPDWCVPLPAAQQLLEPCCRAAGQQAAADPGSPAQRCAPQAAACCSGCCPAGVAEPESWYVCLTLSGMHRAVRLSAVACRVAKEQVGHKASQITLAACSVRLICQGQPRCDQRVARRDAEEQGEHKAAERRASKEAKVSNAADKITQLSQRASPTGCTIT